jgi:hypothetical protein
MTLDEFIEQLKPEKTSYDFQATGFTNVLFVISEDITLHVSIPDDNEEDDPVYFCLSNADGPIVINSMPLKDLIQGFNNNTDTDK